PLTALITGILIGILFIRRQKTLKDPLLDLSLFGDASFSTALVSMLFYSMLTGTTMLFLTQYFQAVDGMTPLQAGLGLLPGMAGSIVGITVSPILARRIRPAYLIAGGLALVVVGFVLLFQADATSGAAWLIVGWALNGLGGGPLVSLGTNLVVGSAPPEKAGSAASLSQTSNEFGYGLGIAVVGTLGTAVYRHEMAGALPSGLPAGVADAARESVAGAVAAGSALPEGLAAQVLGPAAEAFTTGMHTVVALTAVLLTGLAVLVARVLRHVPALGAAAPGDAGGDGLEDGHDGSTESGQGADTHTEPVAATASTG
ncbi:MFS transporter, partial [Streptomyces sp. NPDC048577]